MHPLEKSLSKRLTKQGFYWIEAIDRGDAMPETIWDGLARKNAIHAAISVPTEQQEEAKSREHIRILRENLNEGLVLDLGCGYGRIAKYLLPATDKVRGYIGLDRSEEMLKLFFDRHQTRSVERKTPLTLIKSHIGTIPLEDASLDNVITSAVYLHNPKDSTSQSLAEVFRVLKPGGKLFAFASFPNRFGLTGVQGESYLWLLRPVGLGRRNGPIRYFSKKEVLGLLKGFSSVTLREPGFTVLPKSLLVFPPFLNRAYRSMVFDPSQHLFERVLSPNRQKKLCTHFDVIAQK